jgi:hypothetical protein
VNKDSDRSILISFIDKRTFPVSAKANGREPKSRLGRVFNFKLGCFVVRTIAWPIQVQPSLQWKTRPRFRPVSLSLSMAFQIK